MGRYGHMGKKGVGFREPAASRRPPAGGMRKGESDTAVLLVDGECAMCNGIARFAAKRDRAERLRFAALDSAAGRALMARLGIALPAGGSFVLVRGSASWTRSAAAIRTLAALDAPWPAAAAALRLVPARLRDAVYDAIAARRHKLAGRLGGHCPAVPDERLRRRLLDGGGWGLPGSDGAAAERDVRNAAQPAGPAGCASAASAREAEGGRL